MTTKLDTRIHFVQELEALQESPRNPYIDAMLVEAKAGEYHDFKNKRYPCGKVAAATHLIEATEYGTDSQNQKIIELRNRLINGDFDESADAEDLAEMRKHLPKEAWKVFGLDRDQ